MKSIKLRCPQCGITEYVERDQGDPELATIAEIMCPECNGGDFDTTRYFDAQGNELEPVSYNT